MAYKNSDTSLADAAESTLSLLGNLASAPSLVSSIDLTSLQ